MEPTNKQRSVYLPAEIWRTVRIEAARRDIPASDIVEAAVRAWLAAHQIAIVTEVAR
jgi:hypothetical protein